MSDAKTNEMWDQLVLIAYEALAAGKYEAAEQFFMNAVTMGPVLQRSAADMRRVRSGLLAASTKLAAE